MIANDCYLHFKKLFLLLCWISVPLSLAQSDESMATDAASIAKDLSNPVAALISLPMQLNYDQKIGPDEKGQRWTLNIQPVIPFEMTPDWNIISRTILPVITQKDIYPGAGSQTGIGDILQSLFFSPRLPTASGWVWGVGPVFMLPTGSDDLLTTDEWSAGPTGVALKQNGPWSYGALVNHLWSFGSAKVNATFMQPFLVYNTPTAWTFALNTESTYDWHDEAWSVPINFTVSKVLVIGNQMLSLGAGARYWAESFDNGPHGWGGRLMLTFIFAR